MPAIAYCIPIFRWQSWDYWKCVYFPSGLSFIFSNKKDLTTAQIKQELDIGEVGTSKRLQLSRLVIPGLKLAGSTSDSPIYIPDSPFRSGSSSSFPSSAVSTAFTDSPLDSPLPSPSRLSTYFFPSVRNPTWEVSTEPAPLLLSGKLSANMYVCDMVNGFLKMEGAKGKYNTRFFGTYKQAAAPYWTYHDQTTKWKNAPPQLRQKAYDAKRTSAGTWLHFMKEIRTHNLSF